jgi:16S rRNA (cytosine967-C5)-methyltransferase
MSLLRKTLAAAGADRVRLVQMDLLHPVPFTRPFDLVLVDAPCSGLGTLRRDPDLRWRRHERDLPALAAAELVMLQHAAAASRQRPSRLRHLFERTGGERRRGRCLPGDDTRFRAARRARGGASSTLRVIDARGHLRTEPHAHGLEAFFGAVLVRRGGTDL